jgi:hypothetical protein
MSQRLTWREFKEYAESKGLSDSDTLTYINYNCNDFFVNEICARGKEDIILEPDEVLQPDETRI